MHEADVASKMPAIECPRALQTIFPSSATKTRTPGRRQNGYKNIRWKKYDPSKKSPNAVLDQFVQWQPPVTSRETGQEHTAHLKPKKPEEMKDNSKSKALACLSPVEPLPLNGTRVNPFLALPIKSTETVQDTMDYFITICKGFDNEKSVVPGPVNPHLSLLLPYALRHAILFESMIAVCRASVLLSLGRPIWDDYAFVQHRGSTIAGLNEKLKSEEATDDAALLTVTMLMTLEYLCGDQRGVLMHCQGLERMLELRGPLPKENDQKSESDWVRFVKVGLTAYKALGSFVTGQPPEVPRESLAYLSETFQELQLDQPLAYPETPFSPDLCIILSRLPSGVSELCLMSQISIQMIKLLASISAATALLATETVGYNNLLDGSWIPPAEREPFPETSQYEEERKQMMVQTILSSLQRMSLTSTRPMEYHLTSGLLAFLFQLRGLHAVNLFYDPILRNFITTLPNHAKPSSPQEQHCLIWSSIAVAGTLALRVVPMPDSHLVMDHALDLYPQARHWPRLEKILRTYFYTEEIGAHWKRVWQSAMNRRQFLLRQRNQQVSYNEAEFDYSDMDIGEEKPAIEQSADSRQMLGHLSKESPAFDMDSDAIKAHIRQHIAGAPRSMFEMSQAMGLCPFRPQMAKSAPSTVASSTAPTAHGTPSLANVSTPSSTVA